MNQITAQTQSQPQAIPLPVSGILQRKCACGSHTIAGGKCTDCNEKEQSLQRKLANPGKSHSPAIQRKLTIGASDDPLEQEAERVADQVLAMLTNPTIRSTPPRIQRLAGRGAEHTDDVAPPSVNRILASSGRPLEPSLRQDMEQRFSYDFSRVRIHSGTTAEQSAREVNANAYTVGHNIVFGSGQFAPGTPGGRHLLAHELVHVVQQGAVTLGTIQRQSGGVAVHSGQESAALTHTPYEKWSETIEQQYRMRGDLERADAVRACRTEGPARCAQILTAAEAYRLYNLVSTSLGDPAMGGVAPATGDSPLVAGAPLRLPEIPLPETGPRVPPPVSGEYPITPRAGPAQVGPAVARLVAASVAVVITAIVVRAAVELWEYLRFQEELHAQGFIILEDPQALCAVGCHIPSRPVSPLIPEFPPRQSRDPGRADIERWLRGEELSAPQPLARPRETEEQRNCMQDIGAPPCVEPVQDGDMSRDQILREWMERRGYRGSDLGDVSEFGSEIEPGQIDVCDPAPARRYHAQIRGTREILTIFACLCCDIDGVSRWQWHPNIHRSTR